MSTEDGRFRWQYDVTDQWDNPDNTGHLIIVTEHIDIPEPGSGADTGFGPGVENWNEHVIDITVGL